MSDPTRLHEEGEASVRALLDSLRADAPSPEASAKMWKQIAAHSAGAGAATSALATASSAKASLATKAAAALVPKALAAKVGVVIAFGAMGAVYLQTRREPPRQAAPVVERATQDDARAIAQVAAGPLRFAAAGGATCVEGAEVSVGCGVTAEVPAIQEPAAPRPRRARADAKPAAKPAAKLDALQAESQLLAQARARLRAGDLDGTEQALQQARDKFEHGALGQEREVLQIELLAALGDREGADHRARRFLRKHPDSPHAKSVQRFLLAP